MSEEFNLSNCILMRENEFIHKRYVKIFIAKLKARMSGSIDEVTFNEIIDELSGEKLK